MTHKGTRAQVMVTGVAKLVSRRARRRASSATPKHRLILQQAVQIPYYTFRTGSGQEPAAIKTATRGLDALQKQTKKAEEIPPPFSLVKCRIKKA